jgi:hypothetical protein
MSRYIKRNPKYLMAYGSDPMDGLFIEIYERAKSIESDEGIVVSLSQYPDMLTPERVVKIARQYGFWIEPPERTITYD